MPPETARTAGLRARKKARTKADLQRHALRLFRDRGYTATTVDDIAAAAEVSRSTFFRYFATKEQVVLYDDVDPLLVEAFAEQPPGTPLLTAFRTALRLAFDRLPAEKRELEEVRMELARTVPEIKAAVRDEFTVGAVAARVAADLGRSPDEPDVLIFAGTVLGGRLAAQELVERHPGWSYIDALDLVFERLQRGVPLVDEPIRVADAVAR